MCGTCNEPRGHGRHARSAAAFPRAERLPCRPGDPGKRTYRRLETLTAETDGSAYAARFRKDHHLGVQPLGDLLEVIEQTTGIDVAVLNVGPDEHGLTMRDPVRETVFIGVARTRNPVRQRSTLA